MNNKYKIRIIRKHGGIISFGLSFLLILFLDAINVITFDSVMPYLTGIGLWAITENIADPMVYPVRFFLLCMLSFFVLVTVLLPDSIGIMRKYMMNDSADDRVDYKK